MVREVSSAYEPPSRSICCAHARSEPPAGAPRVARGALVIASAAASCCSRALAAGLLGVCALSIIDVSLPWCGVHTNSACCASAIPASPRPINTTAARQKQAAAAAIREAFGRALGIANRHSGNGCAHIATLETGVHRVRMATEEIGATELWVESHELATPGKRLTWHLSHFHLKASQCHFAGKPLAGTNSQKNPTLVTSTEKHQGADFSDCVSGRDPLGEPPHWRGEREVSGTGVVGAGAGFADVSAGGGGQEGEVAGGGEVVGKRVSWRFVVSRIVLAVRTR